MDQATLARELKKLEGELQQANARIVRLEQLADTDEFLSIANRRAFERALRRSISSVARYGDPICVVSIDINGMKLINDNYGHPAGDAALKTVADVLSGNTRATDLVARVGGDEFAMILAHVDEAAAEAKCRHLAEQVRDAGITVAGEHLPVDIAFGVAAIPRETSPEEIMIEADRRMYRMKAESRNPARGRI